MVYKESAAGRTTAADVATAALRGEKGGVVGKVNAVLPLEAGVVSDVH